MEPTDGAMWRLVFDHSPVGVALVGPDGRLIAVNRAFCDMLGYDEGALLTKTFQELTHPDDLEEGVDVLQRALAGEIDGYRLHKRYLHADGRVVWGDLSTALVRDDEGRPLHFISQVLDVTELEHERQTLSAIFETVNVGLLLIDRDGRYERMNRRHEETMRLPFPDGHDGEAGQLGHVYQLDGHSPMGREEMPSYRAAQGEEFDELRYWVGQDPISRAAFSVTARNVRDADGERTGSVLAYQDITDLMRAMQVKDAFVASVSHELRTPLTAVLGYLELLDDHEDLTDDVREQVRVVRRNALRLQALVSDLLQVAQAREGSLQLDRVDTDLCALVRDAVGAAGPWARSSGLVLRTEMPDRLVALVDPHRIRQVLDNLVSNGIKYTDRGGCVTVRLAQHGEDVVLEVEDTGIGIATDELDQVFARFFRGDEVKARHIPGTGLGLSIVSSIVEAHAGEVSLQSQQGEGSTFRVTVPGAVLSPGPDVTA